MDDTKFRPDELGGLGSDGGQETAKENRAESSDTAQPQQVKERSFYYSYGPYQSDMKRDAIDVESASAPSEVRPEPEVEMTAPRPVKPVPIGVTGGQTAGRTVWQPPAPKKRNSFFSMFAAFMAGVVLVGGLMFASDYYNWFSGAQVAASETGKADSAAANGSVTTANNVTGSGDARTADLGSVVRPNNIADIVSMASPAVVKIDTYVTARGNYRYPSIWDDDFFRFFFGDTYSQPRTQPGTRVKAGMGSGFIFEKSGYILTNQHVVDGAEEIEVTVEGYDSPFKAKLLGSSYDLDLAVLKIEGDNSFPILPIGDSNQMKVGDWVIAIGNPYGFDHTVTVGVLSAGERELSISDSSGTRNYKHLLQTDASINPGNSGGPLLNLNGEVIGINTAVNASAQGIGFAIPTSTISSVLDKLKENVEIPKEPIPFVGIEMNNLSSVSEADRKVLGINGTDGALITNVIFGSPAFQAGLRTYDVILSVDGEKIKTYNDVTKKVQSKKVGDKITFGIFRNGSNLNVEVTIGDKNEYASQNE